MRVYVLVCISPSIFEGGPTIETVCGVYKSEESANTAGSKLGDEYRVEQHTLWS